MEQEPRMWVPLVGPTSFLFFPLFLSVSSPLPHPFLVPLFLSVPHAAREGGRRRWRRPSLAVRQRGGEAAMEGGLAVVERGGAKEGDRRLWERDVAGRIGTGGGGRACRGAVAWRGAGREAVGDGGDCRSWGEEDGSGVEEDAEVERLVRDGRGRRAPRVGARIEPA